MAVPVSWPGFQSWQPQAETTVPADSVAQDFVLELNHPATAEFPVTIDPFVQTRGMAATVDVFVDAATEPVLQARPAQIDAERSRLRLDLSGIPAGAGNRLMVVLHESSGGLRVRATEYDSYPLGERWLNGRQAGGDLAFRVFYRRALVELWLQGIDVGFRSAALIVAAFLSAGAFGLLVMGWLRKETDLDLAALVAAGVGAGLWATSMIGLLAGVAAVAPSAWLVGAVSAVTLLLAVRLWRRTRRGLPSLDAPAISLAFVLGLVAVLNLSYAAPL
jgi:hypothetical protein